MAVAAVPTDEPRDRVLGVREMRGRLEADSLAPISGGVPPSRN
jgi:hypothetical protein